MTTRNIFQIKKPVHLKFKGNTMKKWASFYLKLSVIGCAIPVLLFCIRFLPGIISGAMGEYPELLWAQYPMYFGFYLSGALCLYVFYQTFRLLRLFDKDQVKGTKTHGILKTIRWSSLSISLIYLVMSPVVYYVADHEDAPGILLIELIILFGWVAMASLTIVFDSLLVEGQNNTK
ncbi:MAG TPA: hypothetical protein DCQ90_11145 [Erysipelotrichaceae bacterium]|nr:hypothetical protein [Erysipelotrichaceae bacterium]